MTLTNMFGVRKVVPATEAELKATSRMLVDQYHKVTQEKHREKLAKWLYQVELERQSLQMDKKLSG